MLKSTFVIVAGHCMVNLAEWWMMWTGASPLLTKGPWAIYLGGEVADLSDEKPWRGVHVFIICSSLIQVAVFIAKRVYLRRTNAYITSLNNALIDNSHNVYNCRVSQAGNLVYVIMIPFTWWFTSMSITPTTYIRTALVLLALCTVYPFKDNIPLRRFAVRKMLHMIPPPPLLRTSGNRLTDSMRRPQPLPTAETGPAEESAAHSAITSKGSKFLAQAPMTLSFSRLPTNHPEALPLAPLVRTPFSPKARQTTGKSKRFSNGALTFHQMAPVSV